MLHGFDVFLSTAELPNGEFSYLGFIIFNFLNKHIKIFNTSPMFDSIITRYNEKQTRNDRIIDDYYEKICSGKQEKPFHEIVLQIGNKDDMGQRPGTDSPWQKYLMNICRNFSGGCYYFKIWKSKREEEEKGEKPED